MSPNTYSGTDHGPLLEACDDEDDIHGGDHHQETNNGGWWKKVLDVQETKKQLLFSLPMIVTNVFYYSITLVSVMIAGHLGELELAGATLANSWAVVTGLATMVTTLSRPLCLLVLLIYVFLLFVYLIFHLPFLSCIFFFFLFSLSNSIDIFVAHCSCFHKKCIPLNSH